jgi:hypothetical protein
MSNKFWGFLVLLIGSQAGMAQPPIDTTAVIGEFNEVMAFAVQPYLHYTSLTTLRTPAMSGSADTGSVLHGEFYKYGDELYYGNEREETFLQDSLMIRINHDRKSIWISKVDVSTKKNMDVLPLKNVDRQKLLRDRYTIGKMPERGDTESIVIRPQAGRVGGLSAGKEILIEYTREKTPLLMKVTLQSRQPSSPQAIQALQAKGFNVKQMMEDDNGVPALVMTQTMTVRFGAVEATKEKVMAMPRWKDRIGYDPVAGTYSGKGGYSGYHVIKTF